MQNKGLLIIIILVVLLVGGYFLFVGRTKTLPAPGSVTREVPFNGGEVVTSVRAVQLEGKEFSFTPSSISVKAGEKVRVSFTNAGSFPHNITFDGLNVASDTISPGESTTVEFTASESGTFNFYCSVGNHRAQGMEGSLEVE